MTTDDPATTPQPGQHVWIEAIAFAIPSGEILLSPVTVDGIAAPWSPSASEVVWHPADAPPQPPIPEWERKLLLGQAIVEAAQHLVAKRNEHHGNPSNPDWWDGWDFDLVRAVHAYQAAQDTPDVPPQPPTLDDELRERLAAALNLDVDEGWQTIAGELMDWAVNSPASPPQPTQGDPQPPNAADQATAPRDDPGATQGAERDFVGEIIKARAHHVSSVIEWTRGKHGWYCDCDSGRTRLEDATDWETAAAELGDHHADAIVAALDLHNLEQTAATAHAAAVAHMHSRDEFKRQRDAARRELQQLRHRFEQWAEFHETIGDPFIQRAIERLRTQVAAIHNNQENQ